jgi:tRNA pseudouridine synthase 10
LVNVLSYDGIGEQLTKRFNLCRYCIRRQFDVDKAVRSAESLNNCHICLGLMDRLDLVLEYIQKSVNGVYQFDTFSIGASLPVGFAEREDQIRARFKIRGRESIKSQLLDELRSRFEIISGRRVDFLLPDVSIGVNVANEKEVHVKATSRHITLAGRYTKNRRGLPQKRDKCELCRGEGCGACSNSGLSSYDSVEYIIGRELVRLTKSKTPIFSWVGSEDEKSLVLGRGRPFFVRLNDPKIRILKRDIILRTPEISAVIESTPKCLPISPIRFRTTTKITVETGDILKSGDLAKLSLLENAIVRLQHKTKTITKKIHSIRARKVSTNHFALTLVADGGLPFKKFVRGDEDTSPSISEIIGTKCECILFDILDVNLE